jgi:hypothetical protein
MSTTEARHETRRVGEAITLVCPLKPIQESRSDEDGNSLTVNWFRDGRALDGDSSYEVSSHMFSPSKYNVTSGGHRKP